MKKKVMTVKASELRTFAESLTSALEQVADKIGAIEDIISGEQEVEDAVADDSDSDEEDEAESEVVESEEVEDTDEDEADDADDDSDSDEDEEEEVVEEDEDEDETDDADDEIKDFSARYEKIKNSLSL